MLRAYEHILADPELPEPAYGQLIRHLQWDGYTLDATGRLHSPPSAALDELPLAGVDDPAASTSISTVSGVMDADPDQAISGARALIGATTKVVLHQLGGLRRAGRREAGSGQFL